MDIGCGGEVCTFLANITPFPVILFCGATDATNGVDVFRREANLVVENQKCGTSSTSSDVSRCYDEL